MVNELEQYGRWIDARSNLISAFDKFQEMVQETERDLEDELNEAYGESNIQGMITVE